MWWRFWQAIADALRGHHHPHHRHHHHRRHHHKLKYVTITLTSP